MFFSFGKQRMKRYGCVCIHMVTLWGHFSSLHSEDLVGRPHLLLQALQFKGKNTCNGTFRCLAVKFFSLICPGLLLFVFVLC